MSTNIEIEAKILVEASDFNKVKKTLGVQHLQPVVQTNYYIDTPQGNLRQFGFALRIRAIPPEFTLTLKSPMAEGTLEKNQGITEEDYVNLKDHLQFPKGEINDFLLMFGFETTTLGIISQLTTERIDTTFEGQHVCLDINHYNGHVDYEIESEQSSLKYAAETLQKLCDTVGIPYNENKQSKYARALDTIQ
jgi:uncharacterized protein YjbK